MVDLPEVESIIERYEPSPASLIVVLQEVQEQWQYLPRDILEYVGEQLSVPLSQVYRVATFYGAFTLQPRGRHLISICTGTACHVRGSGRLLERLQGLLEIHPGETTPNQLFTLETVHCMGCCALGPVIRIDDRIYGTVRIGQLEGILEEHD